ncbi:MAG TPA: DUF3098 domain-containing protein [Vicingaceae bacterium]|jgi:uncharacterized integral membrane protein|nr:DUF3098 domain-containing protein [Vicingaceae bacterium]
MENQKINNDFAFSKKNYTLIIAGVLLLVIGYVLMIGGGSDNPQEFSYELFSAQRVIIAPIVILAGFVVVGWGIMKKSN